MRRTLPRQFSIVFFRAAFLLGWAALVGGIVLQAWVKDQLPVARLLFYAMPKPCLAMLAVVLLVWRGQGRWSRMAAAVALAGISGWWLAQSWCVPAQAATTPPAVASASGGPQPPKPQLKVLYWNLCRPNKLHQGMVRMIQEQQPDVAAFVEPGTTAGELCPAYEALLPGYKAAWMPRGILWLSRLPSHYRDRGKLENIGAYAWFDVEGAGPTFQVVVGDVFPHLFRSRKGQLDEALSHARGRTDAVIVGDFNTPLESVLWKGFRKDYVHAFEAAGSGFKETWPIGLPLLSLDHVWVGRDWEIVEAKKFWRVLASDHAALVVTLRRR